MGGVVILRVILPRL